jgi:hypothetical protein
MAGKLARYVSGRFPKIDVQLSHRELDEAGE